MLFERFEVEGLSHYSYAVGCPGAGKIAIVDPERNIDRYLEFAERKKVRISHVLETHIHADYASGARELAARSGAEPCVSGYDEGETFTVSFDHRDLADGDSIELGSVRLVALHTPGHTPEHLSYLVYDASRCRDVPELLLSGDFLFVGSLGRPDLLGEDAKRALAHKLFHSVRRVLPRLPDGLEVHPAHGAGSMCGAGMSGRPSSTLGFERLANPYLDPKLTEQQFVDRILGTVPPFPPYYRRMKKLNSEGPPTVGPPEALPELRPEKFRALLDSGHVAIDLRDHLSWGGGHIPESFSIGTDASLAVWAAWVVPYETPILVVAEEREQAEYAASALRRVGLDDVQGRLAGGIAAWVGAGLPMHQTIVASVRVLHELLESGDPMDVLDVRTDDEWKSGHIEGAIHIHGGLLADRTGELPSDGAPLAVICGGGYRSSVAASVLERAGFHNVVNVTGGMRAWRAADLPVVRSGAGADAKVRS